MKTQQLYLISVLLIELLIYLPVCSSPSPNFHHTAIHHILKSLQANIILYIHNICDLRQI